MLGMEKVELCFCKMTHTSLKYLLWRQIWMYQFGPYKPFTGTSADSWKILHTLPSEVVHMLATWGSGGIVPRILNLTLVGGACWPSCLGHFKPGSPSTHWTRGLMLWRREKSLPMLGVEPGSLVTPPIMQSVCQLHYIGFWLSLE